MGGGGGALVMLGALVLGLILMLAIGGILLKVALSMVAKIDTTLGHSMVTVLFFSILGGVLSWLTQAGLTAPLGGVDEDGLPPLGARLAGSLMSLLVMVAVIKSRYELSWGGGILTAIVMWVLYLVLFFAIGAIMVAVFGISAAAGP